MSKVICGYVNIFDKNITLFTMDESDPKDTETMGIIDLNDLPTSIYAISQKADTNKVHLFGDETYLLGLADDIVNTVKPKNYNFNSLELEIN